MVQVFVWISQACQLPNSNFLPVVKISQMYWEDHNLLSHLRLSSADSRIMTMQMNHMYIFAIHVSLLTTKQHLSLRVALF